MHGTGRVDNAVNKCVFPDELKYADIKQIFKNKEMKKKIIEL